MRRQQFIESRGATCRNWRWSWSFVNHEKRWVIFGAWADNETPEGQVILTDDWQMRNGRRTAPYGESIQHIELVTSGYALFTFRMERDTSTVGKKIGPSRIKKFTPNIEQRRLVRSNKRWIATDELISTLPNEPTGQDRILYQEGRTIQIQINAYERSAAARARCLMKHGFVCRVCELDLERRYGSVARNFIHVHHLVRIADMPEDYLLDPENDLVPVCPNCHAIIHLRNPMFSIDEVKHLLKPISESDFGLP